MTLDSSCITHWLTLLHLTATTMPASMDCQIREYGEYIQSFCQEPMTVVFDVSDT